MITLDWHDLRFNGAPAVIRALEQLQKFVNSQETKLNLLDHQLHEAQAQQETAIQELQYLWSEEIIDILSVPPLGPITPSEVVAELAAPNVDAGAAAGEPNR